MADHAREPHGPERLPRDQPPPNPTDLTQQASLQQGSSSRWLVPAGVLAGIVIVLSLWALSLNVVIPIIAIAFVVLMWVTMLVVSLRQQDAPRRNRALAWLMGGMALGGLAAFLALYAVEASGVA